MASTLKAALAVAGLALATEGAAQVTLYGNEDFRGEPFTSDRPIRSLDNWGFNDRASSLVVSGGTWQVCEDANFSGRCAVLQPGSYRSLREVGLDNRISSLRPVERTAAGYDAPRYASAPPDGRERWRRRADERLYEVPVTEVRAVVGPPEQRCWVERQEVVENSGGGPNVPGAVIGGVLGGILGHQIGGGRGQDVATVGGAVAGSVIGGNVNRGGGPVTSTRDVQRCAEVPRTSAVDYYDVSYLYQGVEHRVQMASPPGRTILVNRDGEPREP